MTQVTLDIPEEVWEQARREAVAARESVEAYLARRLAQRVFREEPFAEPSSPRDLSEALDLSGLTDDQLRVHLFAGLDPAVQERLTDLQHRNAEGELAPEELE